MADMVALLENQTSDTSQTADGTIDTDAIQVGSLYQSGWPDMNTGHIMVMARGTFNSVTVELEFAPTQSGPWGSESDAQFTAAGQKVTPASPRCWVRPKVSGTGSPAPSVSLYVG